MATISITPPRSISRLSDEALGEIISYLDPYSQNRVLSASHRMMAIVIYQIYQPWNTVEFLEAASKNAELTSTVNDLKEILPPKTGSKEPLVLVPFREIEIRRRLFRVQAVFLNVLKDFPSTTISELSTQSMPSPCQSILTIAQSRKQVEQIERNNQAANNQSATLREIVISLFRIGQIDEAFEVIGKMRDREIRQNTMCTALNTCFECYDLFATAKKQVKIQIEMNHTDLDSEYQDNLLFILTNILLGQGDIEEAIKTANSIEDDNIKTESLENIIEYFIQQKNFQKAREIIRNFPFSIVHCTRYSIGRIFNPAKETSYEKIISACAHAKNVQELQATVEHLLGSNTPPIDVNARCAAEWKKVNPDTEIPSEWSVK